MEKLNAELIQSLCERELDSPTGVHVFDSLPSTNAWLSARCADYSIAQLCIAETQTAGRGRRGKIWHSPPAGVTFSLLRRFDRSGSELSGLSLVSGCAVIQVLERFGARDLKMKWPNDILSANQKLCGLLIEMRNAERNGVHTITGIGVNYRGVGDAETIGQPVVDLHQLLGTSLPDRDSLLAALSASVLKAYASYEAQGFVAFRDQWQTYDAYLGKNIAVSQADGQRVIGLCRGVAESGALLVETDNGLREFYSGEVSVRLDS